MTYTLGLLILCPEMSPSYNHARTPSGILSQHPLELLSKLLFSESLPLKVLSLGTELGQLIDGIISSSTHAVTSISDSLLYRNNVSGPLVKE